VSADGVPAAPGRTGPGDTDGSRQGTVAGGEPLAIWLLPAEPEADRWQSVIDALARSQGSPRFDAHVTVHVGRCPAGADPVVAALRACAPDLAPVSLQAAATAHSTDYYRTLFVPLPGPEPGRQALDAMRHRLVLAWREVEASVRPPGRRADPRAAGATGASTAAEVATAVAADLASWSLDPHLSLLYARLDAATRGALAIVHDFTGTSIRFDRLAFVRPAPGFRDLAEVDRWQVFGHCRLGG
jgi:hypothetical protein